MIPKDSFDDMDRSESNTSEQPLSSMDFSADGGFGISSGEGSGRQIDRNALILVIIVALAIAGLWSMRTLSPTSAETSTPSNLPTEVGVDPIDEEIIHRLAAPTVSETDIGTERDPFVIWTPAPTTDEAALIAEFVDDGVVDRETLCEVWQVEVERISALLKLKSVLGGGTPRALVNIEGVLLTVGESFDIADTELEFTVEGTGRRSVRLGSYNAGLDCWHEVEVSMDIDR